MIPISVPPSTRLVIATDEAIYSLESDAPLVAAPSEVPEIPTSISNLPKPSIFTGNNQMKLKNEIEELENLIYVS
jgi:hypothetical protein